MQDFIDRGDFRRAVITPEFASLSLADQFLKLTDAVKNKISKLEEQSSSTSSRLLEELGLVRDAFNDATDMAKDAKMSTT